jgi:hypothetical protein
MRTLGFRTHVLMTIAAAAGVLAALGRPWYATAPQVAEAEQKIGDLHGPVEDLADAITRWAGETSGTVGWNALGHWATAIAVLAVLTAAGALGCLVPALQGVARELLRYAALACFCLATWKLLDSPGPNTLLEPRYGAFVAVGGALVSVTSGLAVAGAPLRGRRTVAPAPQPLHAPPASTAPPGF